MAIHYFYIDDDPESQKKLKVLIAKNYLFMPCNIKILGSCN